MAAPYWSVTVQPTSAADPKERHPRARPLKAREGIHPGLIKGIKIWFPPGCAGLVGVQIYHREHILAPADEGEWVTGDGVMWEWETAWPIMGPGNYIGILVSNDDDTFEHTISVALSHVPLELLPMTDAILSEMLMLLYDVKNAILAIPRAIEAAIQNVMNMIMR